MEKISVMILFICLLCVDKMKVTWAAKTFELSKDLTSRFIEFIELGKKLISCGFEPKQVRDVGASKGEWTKSILSIYPNAQYLLVEANDFFEPLLKDIDQTYEVAMISDKILPNAEFYIGSGDSAGSSMHRENSQHPFHKIVRPSHTIDELAQKHNWNPDILKIDIQGSEFQALRGATKVLKTATIVFIEAPVHNFNQGAASFRQISILLSRAGFELYDVFGENYVGQFMIQFDAVYVRKSSSLWSQACTGFPVPGTFRLPTNSKTVAEELSSKTTATTTSNTNTDTRATTTSLSWLKEQITPRLYEEEFWKFGQIGCGYKPAVIMDVGAASGKWSIKAKENFPDAKLFLIEANPEFESSLKSLNTPYEMVLVSDKESSNAKFHVPINENVAGGSLLTSNIIPSKLTAMASTTLDALARKHNLYPDLLKLDVQGGEYLVLKGATEVMKSASMITLEIQIHNLYQGAPSFRQIATLLWKAGFELYDIYGFNFLGYYIVQFDAVFVRTSSFLWHQNCTGFPVPAHFKLDVSGKMNQLKDKVKAPFSD